VNPGYLAGVLLLCMLGVAAASMPAAAQEPAPNPPQTSQPGSAAEPAPAPPPQTPTETTDATKAQSTHASKQKPGSSNASQSNRKKKRQSRKRVVREGGATESSAVIGPSMSQEQASHQRQNTAQLLSSTDANLQRLSGRQLNSNQSATIDQIHVFMQQAKAAVDAGDLQRGHNLAMKAHLLSDDLVRH
jgi:outer membrane biosynthesis protein TonB